MRDDRDGRAGRAGERAWCLFLVEGGDGTTVGTCAS